jgi:hypothetical protein
MEKSGNSLRVNRPRRICSITLAIAGRVVAKGLVLVASVNFFKHELIYLKNSVLVKSVKSQVVNLIAFNRRQCPYLNKSFKSIGMSLSQPRFISSLSCKCFFI